MEGLGQVVLVSGEAGIGKTRITETVCARLQGVPHTRLDGHCSPYRHHTPMHVVAELIQGVLGYEREDSPEIVRRRLERTLAQCGLPPEESLPVLSSLLSLPASEPSPVESWSPQRRRQRTIEIVFDVLRLLAAQSPLLLRIEDLHWIDASSLELLSVFVDQAATMPVCVLLTARPDFRPPWATRSHTAQITLTRLPRHPTEQMILSVARNKPLPAEVLQHVLTGADGVPLYVEEITKMVLESGLLRESNDRYELTAPLQPLAIPATLQDSLTARLDRLSDAKPVAQLAAAIGREFSYELLQAVSTLEPAALQRELGRLVDAELPYQRGLPHRLGHAPEVFAALWGQWGVLILKGDVQKTLEIGEELLERASLAESGARPPGAARPLADTFLSRRAAGGDGRHRRRLGRLRHRSASLTGFHVRRP